MALSSLLLHHLADAFGQALPFGGAEYPLKDLPQGVAVAALDGFFHSLGVDHFAQLLSVSGFCQSAETLGFPILLKLLRHVFQILHLAHTPIRSILCSRTQKNDRKEVFSLKAAVFSDTHSNTALMAEAVRRCRPDVIIHLGDHDRDTEVLLREFPEIPLYSVCGNCDLASAAPNAEVVPLGPVKAYLTHGHL